MKKKEYSILALIPPNREGEIVLKEALYLQNTLGTKLVILNVIKAPSFFVRKFQPQKLEIAIKIAKEDLTNFVKKVIDNEIPGNIVISVRAGNIVKILLDKSKKDGHEFLLVDKSNSDYPGALNKNNIDDLISRSICPVLTINKEIGVAEIKSIFIPIDITQSTRKRLRWAIFFAEKYNAKVTVLSALNSNINKKKSLALKNANKIKHLFGVHHIECDVKVLRTRNYDKHIAVLKHIEHEKPGLVIIRTHQDVLFANTRIKKFVSEIVHGSRTPVFTVNYTPNSLHSLSSYNLEKNKK